MDSLCYATLEETLQALEQGSITSVKLTEALFDRIAAVDSRYKAYLTVDRDGAIAQAEEADKQRGRGAARALTGVPVSIKDNIITKGLRTTCASKLLENFVPSYDATIVARLRDAGAVIIGKTNLDEFCMGGSTENSGFHPTHNPWDKTRVPGGSSGGSAASVVYGGAIFSIGEDTGGSIRQPASFCGIVGCKPTYGRVPRWGGVAMGSSLDQIGPMTRTVRDCAIALGVIAGHEPRDSTSNREPVPDYLEGIEQDISGLKIGFAPGLLDSPGLHPGVVDVFNETRRTYTDLGAQFVEIELPHVEYSISTYYIICPCEVSANMARFDGIRYGVERDGVDMWDCYRKARGQGFGPEVKRRIIIGAFALSEGYYDAYYKKASQVRTLIAQDFKKALTRCDAILMPVTPSPAFKIGELVHEPLKLYLADIFTLSLNLSGLPGICFPAGTVDGLPQGVQLIGRPFDEKQIFRLAHLFEKATPWSFPERIARCEGRLT